MTSFYSMMLNVVFLVTTFLQWNTVHVTALVSGGESNLVHTDWKLSLNVGLEPGTWMPKRFPGWAESGARLGLDVSVHFDSAPIQERESLLGNAPTMAVRVTSDESIFVSERGQDRVQFTNGGWSIQRPNGNIRNAAGDAVRPEGLLRFWLDCPTGAQRRDLEIRPNTRIFFSTGVWDGATMQDSQEMKDEYDQVVSDMQEIARTRLARAELKEQSWWNEFMGISKMSEDAKKFDRLKERKQTLERSIPPPSATKAPNGVQIAPTGSLVIKGNGIPDWLPGSEYLILGTFSTEAIKLSHEE